MWGNVSVVKTQLAYILLFAKYSGFFKLVCTGLFCVVAHRNAKQSTLKLCACTCHHFDFCNILSSKWSLAKHVDILVSNLKVYFTLSYGMLHFAHCLVTFSKGVSFILFIFFPIFRNTFVYCHNVTSAFGWTVCEESRVNQQNWEGFLEDIWPFSIPGFPVMLL